MIIDFQNYFLATHQKLTVVVILQANNFRKNILPTYLKPKAVMNGLE